MLDTNNVTEESERRQLINQISGLYPPDADNDLTGRIGRDLLLRAIAREWRSAPLQILRVLNELNWEEESRP
jgi:hypothetical protein